MRRHIVDGKRIIQESLNFRHFPLFSCPPESVIILQETRKGLHTEWLLACKFCNMQKTIHSEDPSLPLPMNEAAVNAAIHAGKIFKNIISRYLGLYIIFKKLPPPGVKPNAIFHFLFHFNYLSHFLLPHPVLKYIGTRNNYYFYRTKFRF